MLELDMLLISYEVLYLLQGFEAGQVTQREASNQLILLCGFPAAQRVAAAFENVNTDLVNLLGALAADWS